jgi:AraC-like DNA-binding protein
MPLRRFAAVDTTSPDEAREAIGRIFCPHFLSPTTRRAEGFHARHHSAAFPDFSINYVAYGATVEIDPGELSRFFLLQVPIRGSATVRCGTMAAEAEAGRTATVLSPTLPTRMTWREGCEKIIVLIRREAVEAQFAALTHRTGRPVEFATGVDLASPAGRRVLRHVEFLLDAAEDAGPMPEAYLTTLRDGLTSLLLTGLPHSGSELLNRPVPPPAPSAVRRAEAFIAAHADRAVSMAEIAEAAGVCLRSLQDAFKRHRGTTLTETLQAVRLERFREALLDPDGPEQVADIAFAAGFGHLGRAAAAYRARYGEAPSQTLRRRR